MHCNIQRVFDEISRWQVNLSKQLPRGCFPEKADTRGKRGAALLDKTDGDTGSKSPALEHDVDSREGVIMLSQAGKTGACFTNADVGQCSHLGCSL